MEATVKSPRALAQSMMKGIIDANKKAETKVAETSPNDQAVKDEAIEQATKKVEETRLAWVEAKAELRKLTGKPATKTDKGPGVIESILNILKESKKGISKEDILTKLVVLFPDRAPESMKKTVGVQLPARMSKERKVKIVKSDDGKFSIK
jgi:hypothetical protein